MTKRGRPRLAVGTNGSIHTTKLARGGWEARTRFRMATGATKRLRRVGRTKTEAINRLQADVAELGPTNQASGEQAFSALAEAWYQGIAQEVATGSRSDKTRSAYRTALDRHLLPTLGALAAHEVTTAACDRLFRDKLAEGRSATMVRTLRSITSMVCQHAIREGALTTNPVSSVSRITSQTRSEPVALDREQCADLLAKLDARAEPGGLAVPDLVRFMLATGARLGEVLALSGEDIDLDGPTITLGHHIVQHTGDGATRRAGRKSNQPALTLVAPGWALPMLRRCKLAAGTGPVFPGKRMWRQPSNVSNAISKELDDIGYPWVTAHTFRKTVATIVDRAGLSMTQMADQLGNTPGVADRHYRARANNQAMAAALDDALG